MSKLKNSKKSQESFELAAWIPRLFLTAIALYAVILIVNLNIVNKLDIRQIEANIIANRMIYAKDGLSYIDSDLHRSFPGIINYSMFSSNDILGDSLYMPNNDIVAAKITLLDLKNTELKTTYYNEEWYDNLKPKSFAKGSGASRVFKHRQYVLVKKLDVSVLQQAILEIEIITANS